MSNKQREIAAVFRARQLRCTPPRYAVLEYLLRNPVHATAEDIFLAINRTDPRASRATVYNSLHALARAGLVREVLLDGKAARFDANTGQHHHFVCESCGWVEDVIWAGIPPAPTSAFAPGSIVEGYEIVFRGRCADCSRRAPKENKHV